MEAYQKRLSRILAETGALFFDNGLMLKDGRPTPYFVNLGGFNTGRLMLELGSFFSEMLADNSLTEEIDIIVGPSYKGSAIASAAVAEIFRDQGIDLSFDYDRKEAKTHGERSSSAGLFVNNTFFDGCRIFIVDDVVTSMETKYELIEKIDAACRSRGFNYEIRGLGIAVDREQTAAVYDKQGNVILDTKGSNPVKQLAEKTGVPFFAITKIREIVAYLYSSEIPLFISGVRRAMDEATKNEFDLYMETYGRDDILPG